MAVADSPVIMDSSISVMPSTTSPSTGTRSPGRSMTISLASICSIGFSMVSLLLVSTSAVLGCSCASFLKAWDESMRVLPSSHLPNDTSPIIAADASKYVPVPCPAMVKLSVVAHVDVSVDNAICAIVMNVLYA